MIKILVTLLFLTKILVNSHTHDCKHHELDSYYENIYNKFYKNIPESAKTRSLQ